METNTMFMDQKTQNCYDVISPQIDTYTVLCNSSQYLHRVFCRN